MKLLYQYSNNAWGKQKEMFLFDLDDQTVSWNKNDSETIKIAHITSEENDEILYYVSQIPYWFTPITSNSIVFDAGKLSYYLIKDDNSKIKLGYFNNHSTEYSGNDQVKELIEIINKYVILARPFTKKN